MMVYLMLLAHYVADFPVQGILQPIMRDKYKNNWHLFAHASIYGLVFWAFFGFRLDLFKWVAVNAVGHYFIDYCTSRMSYGCHSRALPYEQRAVYGKVKWTPWRPLFWSVIGGDQALHMGVLFFTAAYLGVPLL